LHQFLLFLLFLVLAEHFSLFCGTALYGRSTMMGCSLYLPRYLLGREHTESQGMSAEIATLSFSATKSCLKNQAMKTS
jgi:hypothetical protein